VAESVLWVAVAALLYTYFGYPLVLAAVAPAWRWAADRAVRRAGSGGDPMRAAMLPTVAVLVAAHNEERHIAERIDNILAQDYPSDRIRLYVGSDGSDDGTAAALAACRSRRVVFRLFESRRGKSAVINDLAALATEEILVLTDANTSFDPRAIRTLVRHFSDPGVGIVSGALHLDPAAGEGSNRDHVYWRYERAMKDLEGRIGALLGANGGIYALPRRLFRPLPVDTIVDDFSTSMALIMAGYRCVNEPAAIAYERIPPRLGSEFARRVRIAIGDFQALRRFFPMLDPRRGTIAFVFLSHKVMRWFAPHLMLAALISNLFLAGEPFYRGLLAAQLVFYLVAAFGYFAGEGRQLGILRIPAYFVGMNVAMFVGSMLYLRGAQRAIWKRTDR